MVQLQQFEGGLHAVLKVSGAFVLQLTEDKFVLLAVFSGPDHVQ